MKDNTNEFVSKILAIALVTGALAGCADGVIRVSYKAVTLSAQGYYDKALPLAQESLAIREQTLGPDHPDTAKSLNNLAEIYRSIGRYTEAEPLYKRSLAISEKALGPYHPDTAGSLNNLAFIYNSTGRYAEAETFYKRALAICEKILGPDHPDTARSLTNLAGLYLDSGRFDEGYVIFKKQNSPYGLGKYYLLKKDYSSAQREFARSLSYTRKMGQPHFLIADHTGLGLSYEGMGDYVKAKERFREAINLTESQWKTLAPEVKKDFLTAQTGAGFTRMDAYEGLIRVLVKEKSQGYGKESFVVAEKVKGRLFLEMLATREAKGKTREDETVLKKDMEYQWELMRLHKQLEAETEADQISEETRNALSAKEKEYSTFIEEVKLKGGELASLITADPIGIPALQSLLDPSTTLLEYFTGKEATYAWLVTKNDIKVYEIPITEKDLKEKVDTLLLPNISNKSRRPM
ncbi:MAG: tetratricopeptide repeat-containing protein, partial [Proteobacteria bacterium]|nr:tetratricopeptide repeat-containing protein [Pseudomonadota bacterium]